MTAATAREGKEKRLPADALASIPASHLRPCPEKRGMHFPAYQKHACSFRGETEGKGLLLPERVWERALARTTKKGGPLQILRGRGRLGRGRKKPTTCNARCVAVTGFLGPDEKKRSTAVLVRKSSARPAPCDLAGAQKKGKTPRVLRRGNRRRKASKRESNIRVGPAPGTGNLEDGTRHADPWKRGGKADRGRGPESVRVSRAGKRAWAAGYCDESRAVHVRELLKNGILHTSKKGKDFLAARLPKKCRAQAPDNRLRDRLGLATAKGEGASGQLVKKKKKFGRRDQGRKRESWLRGTAAKGVAFGAATGFFEDKSRKKGGGTTRCGGEKRRGPTSWHRMEVFFRVLGAPLRRDLSWSPSKGRRAWTRSEAGKRVFSCWSPRRKAGTGITSSRACGGSPSVPTWGKGGKRRPYALAGGGKPRGESHGQEKGPPSRPRTLNFNGARRMAGLGGASPSA